jgi:F0F1-type ATP synthase membrane subunit b/b'
MSQNKEGRAYDDMGPNAKAVQDQLRKEANQDLQRKADEKTQRLQNEVTNRLERTLNDIRRELDQVVNRVTAEALKQKAASLGKIKEMTEDQHTGNLTIVLEV